MNDALRMWTVYDSPSDYPGQYVARLWLIERGSTRATETVRVSDDLARLRETLVADGLVPLPRQDGDDPVIVETWV